MTARTPKEIPAADAPGENRLGTSFAVSVTGIAVISFDEGSKNRYGIRLGGRYLF